MTPELKITKVGLIISLVVHKFKLSKQSTKQKHGHRYDSNSS
jgi:hypothetical protein